MYEIFTILFLLSSLTDNKFIPSMWRWKMDEKRDRFFYFRII